jgi:gamma-glutamyltranspeptidase/glutathione hydrolase
MAALQMLNIIEGYDFSDIPFGSAKHLHIVNEAKNCFLKIAKYYADEFCCSGSTTPFKGIWR